MQNKLMKAAIFCLAIWPVSVLQAQNDDSFNRQYGIERWQADMIRAQIVNMGVRSCNVDETYKSVIRAQAAGVPLQQTLDAIRRFEENVMASQSLGTMGPESCGSDITSRVTTPPSAPTTPAPSTPQGRLVELYTLQGPQDFTPSALSGEAPIKFISTPAKFITGNLYLCDGMNGAGIIKFDTFIDEHGDVSSVSVRRSNDPDLKNRIENLAGNWKFSPALQNKTPVATKTGWSLDCSASPRDGSPPPKEKTEDMGAPQTDAPKKPVRLTVVPQGPQDFAPHAQQDTAPRAGYDGPPGTTSLSGRPGLSNRGASTTPPARSSTGSAVQSNGIGFTPARLITGSSSLCGGMSGAGTIEIETFIDERGDVTSVSVIRSNNPYLENHAVHLAGQWKFSPALQNGTAVASKTTWSQTCRREDNGRVGY